MRRKLLAMASLLALTGPMLGAVSPVAAQANSDVTVVHGIPGVDVDVYVNGDLTLESFAPKDVAGPLSLPAGSYDIDIFADQPGDAEASASDRSDGAVIDVDGAAVPGGANISLVAHLDADGDPTLTPFVNNVDEVANGTGRMSVRHTAEAPAVDILANGAVAFGNVPNGVGADVDLAPGTITASINAAGTDTEVISTPLDIVSANNRIVYAIGTLGSTFDLIVQDIAVPEAAPTGAPAGVSVVHGIPGLTVDVYANGGLLLPAFAPDTVTDVLTLPSGAYDIEIFGAVESPASTSAARTDDAAVSVVDAVVPAGSNVTLVAHLNGEGAPVLTPFVNNTSRTAEGNGRIEVRHTAQAPTVDIVAGGAAVTPLSVLSNGDAKAAELPAGDYPTGIAATGTTAVLFDAPVTSVAGQYTVIYATGVFPDTFGLVVQTFDVGQFAGDIASAESFDEILAASDYDPRYGEILRLYQAFFNREADVDGAQYWIEVFDNGGDIGVITANFASTGQPEFVNKYADIAADDYDAYVTRVYQHILDRDPDAGGLAYWTGLMESGELDRGGVVRYIALNEEFINLYPYNPAS